MGQDCAICHESKHEYIDPWAASSGTKLWEICMNDVAELLPYLLAQGSNGSGGDSRIRYEDFRRENGTLDDAFANCGRWAGDRITVVGDYDESGVYQTARDSSDWTGITQKIREEARAFLGPNGFNQIQFGNDRASDPESVILHEEFASELIESYEAY